MTFRITSPTFIYIFLLYSFNLIDLTQFFYHTKYMSKFTLSIDYKNNATLNPIAWSLVLDELNLPITGSSVELNP